MFKHLFKMIWNKKKQNFLLMSEMLISFLVIFAVCTLAVYYYRNYKNPMGMEYENVWAVSYENSFQTGNADSLEIYNETLRQTLQSMPQVKKVSFCGSNTPFSNSTSQNGTSYNGRHLNNVNYYLVDDHYKDAMHLDMLEGRWFDKQDAVYRNRPIVINNSFKKFFFGSESAIGKLVGDADIAHRMKVIGVVEDVKMKGDYVGAGTATYNRIDTSNVLRIGKMMINVAPGADAAFESRLYKTMANYMKTANIEIEHLTDKRKTINNFALVPMIVLSIVACFLIINVALGLFGVLWYNINKRRGEIGLRRAVGATGQSVSAQIVAETMILATLSLFIGTFFAVQFPLLDVFDLPSGVYITAILLAIAFIYLLVFVCALYPGRQAAGIYPAVALHEE
jgi:putative ABC transport system permease protein